MGDGSLGELPGWAALGGGGFVWVAWLLGWLCMRVLAKFHAYLSLDWMDS